MEGRVEGGETRGRKGHVGEKAGETRGRKGHVGEKAMSVKTPLSFTDNKIRSPEVSGKRILSENLSFVTRPRSSP